MSRFVNVDAIAILAGATVLCGNSLNAIVDNQRAVFVFVRRPHLNAIVANVMHMIAGNLSV